MFLFPRELFLFCKVVGVSPIKIVTLPTGARIPMFSLTWFIWSIFFITLLCSLCIYAMYVDYIGRLAGSPVRMRTHTAIVATVCDVSTLMIVGMVGVIASGKNCTRFIQMINDLRKFDQILNTNNIYPSSKLYLTTGLIYITGLLVCDGITRHQLSGNHEIYLPFLMLYYMLTAIHLQFAHIVISIKLRFQIINERIKQEVLRKRFKRLPFADLPKVESIAGNQYCI